MEYFGEDKSFLSSATWSGLTHSAASGASVAPVGVASDCCYHDEAHNETSAVVFPPEADGLEVRFTGGRYVSVAEAARATRRRAQLGRRTRPRRALRCLSV